MPINYARRLTGGLRTLRADKHLGLALAFVAGAINAGGFLAVPQYTSHMTGIGSALADSVGNWNKLHFLASLAICFFFGGVAGAVGFKHLGYISTVPLAMLLVVLAVVPAIDDAMETLSRWIGK
jgi:uncharacterized membrane protein YoaK (UPF0700 family)